MLHRNTYKKADKDVNTQIITFYVNYSISHVIFFFGL